MYDILLIEDDRLLLRTMTRALEARGYSTLGCESPERALEAAREHEFTLVLADYVMPGTNGLQLLAQVRELQPEARLAVHSGLEPDGWADEQDVLFLQKPCSCARIAALLGASEVKRPAGSPFGDPLHLGHAAFAGAGAR